MTGLAPFARRLERFGGHLLKPDGCTWWDQHEAACAAYDRACASTHDRLVKAGLILCPAAGTLLVSPIGAVVGALAPAEYPVALVEVVQDGARWVAHLTHAPWWPDGHPLAARAVRAMDGAAWPFVAPPQACRRNWSLLTEVVQQRSYDRWAAAGVVPAAVNAPVPTGAWELGRFRRYDAAGYLSACTGLVRGAWGIGLRADGRRFVLIHLPSGRVMCEGQQKVLAPLAEAMEPVADWHWARPELPQARRALALLVNAMDALPTSARIHFRKKLP